jgi:hypothetical protein
MWWLMHFHRQLLTVSECLSPLQSISRPWQKLRKMTQNSPTTPLIFAVVPHLSSPVTLICDVRRGTPRPFVPAEFCRTIFCALHSLSHPGIRATQHFIMDHCVCMSSSVTTVFASPCSRHTTALTVFLEDGEHFYVRYRQLP